MGFDIKKVLGTVAPMIGSAIGGPLGGAAASMLVKTLGLKSDPTKPVDVTEELSQMVLQPADLLKLKEAEMQFQKDMAELNIKSVEDMEKIAADDRASARDREKSVRDKIPGILAIGVTLGFFGLLAFLLRHAPPADSKDVLNIMLGSLGTAWVSIVAYYFGSSAGSAAKTELLAKSNPKGEGQ